MDDREALPWHRRLVDIRYPFIWLAYLPLYCVTWIGRPPSTRNLLVSLGGIALFLVLYFYAEAQSRRFYSDSRYGRAVIPPAIATLVLAIALIPFGGNWSVIAIYACSIAADIRPNREAAWVIAVFILVSVIAAAAIGTPWYFLIMFAVFEFMVVYGKLSGTLLAEKNWALTRAQEEVRLLAQTAERERIGRDLHDLLGRTLTLIALKSDLAVKLGDGEAARREMKEVGDTAREGLSQVRAAVAGMTAGLAHEIDASRQALAAAGIACEVVGEDLAIGAASGAVLAMALREGVTNVIRHAGATTCRISLANDGEAVNLVVADDGQGGHFREGAGLRGMRARLSAAGGRLRIEASHLGTSIAAAIPAGAR
ncbi:MAG: Two-component sensor histidine kinase [Alphaproteobacteria bacterium]|nr:Two-component sensor histidine kinase [Alphaproteobacteria bacterium]